MEEFQDVSLHYATGVQDVILRLQILLGIFFIGIFLNSVDS